MSKKWKIGLAASGIVAALVIGTAAITGSALAQEIDPPAEEEADRPPRLAEGPRGRAGGRRGGPGNLEAIADALGLTAEELEAARAEGRTLIDLALEQDVDIADVQAAMEAARQAQIEQAVEEGRLSEEQAEEILETMPPAGWPLLYHDQMEAALAEALGISVDELEAARAEEGRLHEALGIDVETFREAKDAAMAQILEQAMADGVLTEAQAAAISSNAGPGGHGSRGGIRPSGSRCGAGGRGTSRQAPPTTGE